MHRDPAVYIEDILRSAERIGAFMAGLSRDQFFADIKTQDAVVRNLEVIGEAVKRLPDDLRRKHPEIEWRRIAGLRDILIHAYFGIDLEVVWNIINDKLPGFVSSIRNIEPDAGQGETP